MHTQTDQMKCNILLVSQSGNVDTERGRGEGGEREGEGGEREGEGDMWKCIVYLAFIHVSMKLPYTFLM